MSSPSTVVSGGFPGRIAQEVNPNPKCNGCLHYDGQAGRVGACLVGLRPWLCGEGEMQDIGYAPITRGAGSYLPPMGNHPAQAGEVSTQEVSDLHGAGSTRGVTFQQVSLGEEHVQLVKSMFSTHVERQQSMCRLCKSRGTIGMAPANVGPQVCTCEPIAARDIAKALVPRMSNAQRMSYDLDEITDWVRGVAKAGFKMPAPMAKSVDIEDVSDVDELAKSLRWSHKNAGHASASHGKYSVVANESGGHTATYTSKETGKTHARTYGSQREAMGAIVEHHLKNRPPPKPRKKKDPSAPKTPKGRAGGCPPCP